MMPGITVTVMPISRAVRMVGMNIANVMRISCKSVVVSELFAI
jgi:hypothetical protein